MRHLVFPAARRRVVAALGLAASLVAGGCAGTAVGEVTVRAPAFDARVRLLEPTGPVNRAVLGSNIQWVDGGDRLLEPGTTRLSPQAVALVEELGPTILRYPGGSQGDTYRWQLGVGPLSQRGEEELYFARGRTQRVLFGTPELLELSERIGAEPLITVNATTGSAEDAAAWVRAVNRTGVPDAHGDTIRRPVRYWEIDNEPYLKQDARPELAMTAREYARRATAFIRAMRAEDPSIVIGVPLRSDTVGAIMLEQQTPGFAATVLSEVQGRIDYVALHNTYFPFLWNPAESISDAELFRATMGAARVVERDFEHTRGLLRRHRPGEEVRLAVTEFSSLFALGGERDGYIATLGGALYVADLLRLFATTPDLLLANHWSLSDNWYFGAISAQLPMSSRMERRPVFHVLSAYGDVLRGAMLATEVESPTFDAPAAGLLPAQAGVPRVAVVATRDTAGSQVVLRVLLLNRDAQSPARLELHGPAGELSSLVRRELADSIIFDVARARRSVQWRTVDDAGGDERSFPLRLELPPHSLTWIEARLEARR